MSVASPGRYDITIVQGASFDLTMTWNDATGSPINLTGYTGAASVEAVPGGATMLAFTVTLGGAAGTVRLQASSTLTTAVTQNGRYDVRLTDGSGIVTRLVEGAALLDPQIT